MESKSQNADAEEILGQVGQTIQARYNPQNPKEHISELEQIRWIDILSFLIALLFLFTAVAVLLTGMYNSSTPHR